MKQITNKLCNKCLGCNRLEEEKFNGVYKCENYAKEKEERKWSK